jgi:hypothetical protein
MQATVNRSKGNKTEKFKFELIQKIFGISACQVTFLLSPGWDMDLVEHRNVRRRQDLKGCKIQ